MTDIAQIGMVERNNIVLMCCFDVSRFVVGDRLYVRSDEGGLRAGVVVVVRLDAECGDLVCDREVATAIPGARSFDWVQRMDAV